MLYSSLFQSGRFPATNRLSRQCATNSLRAFPRRIVHLHKKRVLLMMGVWSVRESVRLYDVLSLNSYMLFKLED
jgi:hypothetical protein